MTGKEIDSKPAAEVLERLGLSGMDIVRLCGISVRMAYQVKKGRPLKSPIIFHKLTTGLRKAGYDVSYEELAGIPS